MKTLLISMLVAISVNVHAETPEQQFIQCQVKPEEYANNQLPAVALSKMAIKIAQQTATDLLGEFESAILPVHQNYAVRISGYIMKPGSRFIKGGTLLLLTSELLQVQEAGLPSIVLAKDTTGSDTHNSPGQLAALQKGAIITRSYLNNSEYLNAVERKEKIKKDQVTSVSVTCELVK